MLDKRFVVKESEGNSLTSRKFYVIIDRETGVNYLYVASGYGIAMTPLLDREGKPIISMNGPEYYS
ncbi:MAG: xylan 1,4-beta-xylosidase [Lachnospiraceae bacterium]|nr:xylan 1,4-beta-xylosidase [Lachnospiraceae bacterium]MBO7633967.1 xylan 1,4-beta-xylosidase [Lachnospiraceae bacterium]MBP5653694.1 xylan 1,4-beta-xylosidase [Lachnospiraceae bacterium]